MTDDAHRIIDAGGAPIETVVDGRALGIRYAYAARGEEPEAAHERDAQRVVASPQPADALSESLLGFDPFASMPHDEDCFRLSVTAPAELDADERLPVMVWVHGGGYRTGAGDASIYDPAALVAEGRVVVVTVTYRLGAFGFMRTKSGQPANLGLLDVLEALRWVHRNIASFGGDAGNVTLFGQSSGADLIAKLMTLGETTSLAHRVILQSAPFGIVERPVALDLGILNVADGVLAHIDRGDLEGGYALVDAVARPFGLAGAMPFTAELGQRPVGSSTAIARADAYDVLVGYTAEETRFFLPGLQEASRVLRMPVLGALLSRIVVRATGRRVYERENRRYAADAARQGARVTSYVLGANRGRPPIGAGHTVDIGLLFPLPQAPEWERAAGRAIRRVWTDFARSGQVDSAGISRKLLRLRRFSAN